ncbi:E3 ubiquitin-protein ligase TRIM45-like [Ruditapes philippinarum]|uniref:E3 ubiquitin-protein ligase TRIM45-like n=1 Tax=Ruditapes philippinarum TaxID=129788 RepID=UPI00295B84EE|nr:E3 ubiquitin-protein ligase TRIM45-like [Ruditapes philippinarum]
MNAKGNNCEACLREDIKVEAIVYCSDCSEKLCEDCKRHHKKNKVSSNHKLIDIIDGSAEKLDLADFEYLANLSKCPLHGTEEVKYLCKDHDQLCCNECAIVTHRKCEDMVSLSDEIKSNKEASKESCIEKRLDRSTIDSYVEKLISHETTFLTKIDGKEDEVKVCLKDLKVKLDAAFCKLEKRIMLEMSERKQVLLKASSLQRDTAEQLRENIKQCGEKMKMAKANGTAIHLFLLEREMGKHVTEFEKTFTTLRQQSSKSLITLSEARPLQDVVRNVENLYQIKEMKEEPVLPAFTQTKDFKNRKLTLEREVSLNEGQPSYCVWIGNYIVVSFPLSSKLVAYKADNGSPLSLISTYQCDSPTSVTATENDVFAVALPSSNKIDIMKIEQNKMTVLRSLTCQQPNLLTYDKKSKNLLIMNQSESVVKKITLDGKDAGFVDLSRIDRNTLQNTYNLYVDSQYGHVFISSHGIHKLLCLDMSGNMIFQHEIAHPWSVITDSQGNIYVGSYETHCIQQLSSNGQLIKANILGEYKMNYPMAMCFNQDMVKMVVTFDESGGMLRLFKFE